MNTAFAAGSIYVAASGTAKFKSTPDVDFEARTKEIDGPRLVRFTVTQEDIDLGDQLEPTNHPIARALLRAGFYRPYVGSRTIGLSTREGEPCFDVKISEDVNLFVLDYICGKTILPTNFMIDIPQDYNNNIYIYKLKFDINSLSKESVPDSEDSVPDEEPPRFWLFSACEFTAIESEGRNLEEVILEAVGNYWSTIEESGEFSEEILIMTESPLRSVANLKLEPKGFTVTLTEPISSCNPDEMN